MPKYSNNPKVRVDISGVIKEVLVGVLEPFCDSMSPAVGRDLKNGHGEAMADYRGMKRFINTLKK